MDDIERRSLSLFARWHADKGCTPRVVSDCANGIIRPDELTMELLRMALTPPEGYVILPVKMTHEMYVDFFGQWFAKPRSIDDTEMEDCYDALIAARPEV